MYTLSPSEMARYNRQILLPEFGIESQHKLKESRVLIIGSGGLGSPALLYLAAAGVGTIGIVDYDMVEESNLQRQIIFNTASIGQQKVLAAEKRLKELNPHVKIILHNTQLNALNAIGIISGYDVVADGSDNFPTRYLVNDACVLSGKPEVYASVYRFEGQVSVFNYSGKDGTKGPDYRDLYPLPPPPELVPSCAEGGVLGVLPGIIGSMQALEVIKIITGIGETLSGRYYMLDALTFESRTFRIKKRDDNPVSGKNPTITELIDYDQFCGMKPGEAKAMQEISVEQLLEWKKRGDNFQLIDVREPYEYEINNIGGELIPFATIGLHTSKINRTIPVVLHCKSGSRSAAAIKELEARFGYTNLYNLKGGIEAYLKMQD